MCTYVLCAVYIIIAIIGRPGSGSATLFLLFSFSIKLVWQVFIFSRKISCYLLSRVEALFFKAEALDLIEILARLEGYHVVR